MLQSHQDVRAFYHSLGRGVGVGAALRAVVEVLPHDVQNVIDALEAVRAAPDSTRSARSACVRVLRVGRTAAIDEVLIDYRQDVVGAVETVVGRVEVVVRIVGIAIAT